jgi:hypothetical protein
MALDSLYSCSFMSSTLFSLPTSGMPRYAPSLHYSAQSRGEVRGAYHPLLLITITKKGWMDQYIE